MLSQFYRSLLSKSLPRVLIPGFHGVVMLSLLIFCASINAEIYKWVDEKGKAHFSDRPIENSNTVELTPINEGAKFANKEMVDFIKERAQKAPKPPDVKKLTRLAERWERENCTWEYDLAGNDLRPEQVWSGREMMTIYTGGGNRVLGYRKLCKSKPPDSLKRHVQLTGYIKVPERGIVPKPW
jgi:hypothetical protein